MREESIEQWTAGRCDDEVHVWHVVLDIDLPSEMTLADCLSVEERERAARIRSSLERQRFTLSRIALRHILSDCHGLAPAALTLRREAGGRPFMEGEHGLSFSLTHSHGLALIAVASRPVGIDVERVRPVEWQAQIAQRVMHPDTVRALAALPPRTQTTAFIDAWTQREAHVKALGGGIFRTPDDLPFHADLPADGSVHALSSRSSAERWSVARFIPQEHWRATVAVRGEVVRVRRRTWTPRAE